MFRNTAGLFVIQLPMVHRSSIMMGQHTSSQQPSYFHNLPSFRVPTYSLCRVGVDVNTMICSACFLLKMSITATHFKRLMNSDKLQAIQHADSFDK